MNNAENPQEHQPSVLIVDDQPANIHILAQIIGADYVVRAATSSSKALQIAMGDNPPDLILLDVMMPEMDGYELCRLLKDSELTRNIPIIFATAKDSATDEEYGFNLGAVDYITKPFRPAVVRARVRNHINLKVKTDHLEQLSHSDSLTGIPNRRAFDLVMEREWNRSMRDKTPLSLLMLDIDNFKLYNDNYGHGAGDECLKKVAQTLRKNFNRPADFCARYGGEEFVAILPDTELRGAVKVAEKIRSSVVSLQIPHAYSEVADCITVSIGAVTHTASSPAASPDSLLKKADSELYRAKNSGRNQTAYS